MGKMGTSAVKESSRGRKAEERKKSLAAKTVDVGAVEISRGSRVGEGRKESRRRTGKRGGEGEKERESQ